ncbi:MAG: phosphate acyltransferase PlsX [Oscillospiraceae bacterium]|nr:phosphate acyltransferase PlsX [Oscillospiraceae bacterium]
MRIIVDAMGGDHAPLEIVKGALMARDEYGLDITFVGRTEDVLRAMDECGLKELPSGVEIANATEVIEMTDDPANAFRVKKDSSMTVGLNMLKEGKGDAFISAGSTGALLSASTLLVKRVRGIRRVAFAPLIPTATGRAVLCDCGANTECTVEYLLQFAYLGSFYAKEAMGIENPRVALLNIGAEESKGCELQRETYVKLKEAGEAGRLNFIGNIEGKEAILGGADVVVADGFTGNIMLKTLEGMGSYFAKTLKSVFTKNLLIKLGALTVKSDIKAFKAKVDINEVGGTALLGISKPVIKAHGSSTAKAFCSAIRQAKMFAESSIISEIEKNVEFMKVEKE